MGCKQSSNFVINDERCKTKYTIVDEIGVNSSNKVFRVISSKDFNMYIMKRVRRHHLNSYLNFVNEIKCNHILNEKKWFVPVVNKFIKTQYCYIIYPYYPRGDLFNIKINGIKLFESEIKFYAACLIHQLSIIHANGIIHRDIKPSNILFCEDGYIKLIDFGLSFLNIDDNPCYKKSGTLNYCSPEAMSGSKQGFYSDIYSLGKTLIFLTTHEEKSTFLYLKKQISKPFYDFLKFTTCKFINQRASSTQDLKTHSWFNDFDWNLLYKKKMTAPTLPLYKQEYIPYRTTENSTDLSNYVSDSKKPKNYSF
jgi:serine/threonine protein kinase